MAKKQYEFKLISRGATSNSESNVNDIEFNKLRPSSWGDKFKQIVNEKLF